jgi:hypothetical protein
LTVDDALATARETKEWLKIRCDYELANEHPKGYRNKRASSGVTTR